MKKLTEYKAFTSLYFRLILILLALILTAAGFFADKLFGINAVLIIASIAATVNVFFDYYAFGGISARKQRGMEMVKASFYGSRLIDSALKTDMYLKALLNLTGFIGFIAGELYFSEEPGLSPMAVTMVLLLYPLTNLATRVILFISRRISTTIVVQIFITYLASMFNSLLIFLIGYFVPFDPEEFSIIPLICAAAVEVLSILMAIFLLADCRKGYRSSFYDNSEK